jgi:hypothetical protein
MFRPKSGDAQLLCCECAGAGECEGGEEGEGRDPINDEDIRVGCSRSAFSLRIR